MLKLTNLHVNAGNKEIVKGVNLEIKEGEVHALMGPNGSGKSSLAQALAGSPELQAHGVVKLDGVDLLKLKPEERALKGLFLAFQQPSSIEGVTVSNFLRLAYNNRFGAKMSPAAFRKILKEKMQLTGVDESFGNRYLNDGFSGGEKKRMEVLALAVLEPKFAILDEIDSGLDIDALKEVSNGINKVREQTGMSILLITHYARVLKYIRPDFVHVIKGGQIVKEGGSELAHALEESGYSN